MSSTSRPVALVTGSAQGLGLAAAQELAKEGFDVVLSDIHAESDIKPGILEGLRALGAQTMYFQLDVSDLDAHQGVLEAIAEKFGRLDTLVNNAGIAARPLTDILELSPEAFDRSMDINLRGAFFLSQAFANLLLTRGWTTEERYLSIINVSSIAAEMVNTDRAQYCVTKAGLSMTTKLFALRLAKENIQVHEVRPGFMQTAMMATVGHTVVDDWIEQGRVPIPRWGQPEDVGRAIATLAAGRMPYMTGQPVWIAGGLNIPPAP